MKAISDLAAKLGAEIAGIMIEGSKPRILRRGPGGEYGVVSVITRHDADTIHTVPEGCILRVPEHQGAFGPPEVKRDFPAGTRFRLVRAGDPRTTSLTVVYG